MTPAADGVDVTVKRPWRRPSDRGVRTLIAILSAAVLAGALWRLGRVSWAQLRAPFDLCFESPNLATIKALRAGVRIYDAALYGDVPFTITVYTPLYHHLVAWLPAAPGNEFLAGRVVSLVGALLLGVCVFLVRCPAATVAVPCFLTGALFLFRPVVACAAYLKNDNLALAFSVGALLLVSRVPGRAWAWGGCLAASLAAVATKQSFVAAAAAAVVYLMLREWRVGVRFAGTLALLGLAALGLALAAWGPGFWFSVVTSLQNPVTWDQFLYQWRYVCTQPLFVAVLAGYGLTVAWVLRHRGVAALRDSPWLCYSFCAWAVLLLTIGKTGAAANYFIEPFLASLLWLASVAGVSGRNGRPGWQALCSAVVLTGLAGAELSSANPRLHYTFLHSGLGARYASFRAFAGAEMASLEWRDPKVLNLLMPRVTYDFGRDAYLNDCFHYRLLWRDGKLSPRSLIEALRRHAFDCVILPEDGFTGERAENPALGQIVDAVREYYLDRGVKARIRFFVRPP